MLFPTSASQNGINCWDVHSDASLTHDGGGESESLAGLVKEAISKYSADTSKVFVIGASSGAMDTNVMAATYPDLFNAGISYSGVPAACFKGDSGSTPSSPDQTCAQGQVAAQTSASQWAELARDCDSGYNGTYPRMQIVHGTSDYVVNFANFQAQLDQWSTVHGVSYTGETSNSPVSGWTRVDYGDGSIVRGYRVEGGGHIPPFQLTPTLEFFGLTEQQYTC
jgi:acetylxylan esterase